MHPNNKWGHLRFVTTVSISLWITHAPASDWPQWLGPDRNGHSRETNLLINWPEDGPSIRWRTDLGRGFSAIVVSGNRAFTMYAVAEDEYAVCLDANTGAEIWRFRTGSYYRENQGGDGPRSTPTIDGDHIYVLSAHGHLFALNLSTGEKVWDVDLPSQFGSERPRWGFSTSPLVEGDLLLIEAGGKHGNILLDMISDPTVQATVVALDKHNGHTRWTALKDKMGYSSPIATTINGKRQLIFLTAYAAVGLNIEGAPLWRMPWKTSYDVNAATPVFVAPDKVFISSGYDTGAALLRVVADGVEEIWRNRDMKNQFATSVIYEGHIYGFDNAILKCLDMATGSEQWKARGFGKGSLIVADGHLIILGEKGRLGLAAANPTTFVVKHSVKIFNGKCWTVPALAHGRLFLRDEKEIVCLNLNRESN